MMPLANKLKKAAHRQIAKVHDIVVETIYEVFDAAVLHGGIAIWRCYQGNRFSEDIDVYLPKNLEKINLLFSRLEQKGFVIEKKKIGENSIYSTLLFNGIPVRFEAIFRLFKGSLKEYETIDSNYITVYTLTPEEFLIEKVNTYLKRRKIRDLYDIFFLLRIIEDKRDIMGKLKELIRNYNKPLDESDLQVLILWGLVPSSEKMLEYIKRAL